MIRIIIADDHAIVRRGLIQILDEVPNMEVVGEASTGREVLQTVRETTFDVLVLDISMPEGSALDILEQIPRIDPNLKVLILSMHPEEQYARRMFQVGACGYLTKESAPDELVAAINKVAGGGKYISRSMAEKLAFNFGTEPELELHEKLSNREYQVMLLTTSGKTLREIADELSLSVKTVSTYRSRLLKKLNLKTTADLIRYVLEHKLSGL
jgi:DNA-binding NarL/FixJ family response regulator